MATTRIIPMHINKGKTIAQCLSDRTEYAINPDKTEAGEFVSSLNCALKNGHKRFSETLQSLMRFDTFCPKKRSYIWGKTVFVDKSVVPATGRRPAWNPYRASLSSALL